MFASSFRDDAPIAESDSLAGLYGSDVATAFSVPAYPWGSNMTEESAALAQAHRMLQFIRTAREFFPAMRDLADHPGWEIMLHIFVGGREGRTVTTADLCERTGTWRPLAVRYIEMLFERGLIERDVSADKPDNWALSLTVSAETRLQELLCGFSRDAVPGERAGVTN